MRNILRCWLANRVAVVLALDFVLIIFLLSMVGRWFLLAAAVIVILVLECLMTATTLRYYKRTKKHIDRFQTIGGPFERHMKSFGACAKYGFNLARKEKNL